MLHNVLGKKSRKEVVIKAVSEKIVYINGIAVDDAFMILKSMYSFRNLEI